MPSIYHPCSYICCLGFHYTLGIISLVCDNLIDLLQDETLRTAVAYFKGKSWKKIGLILSFLFLVFVCMCCSFVYV